MSVEGNHLNPFRSHSGYENKEEIPSAWFSGVGTKDDGITSVSFSPEFIRKFGTGIVEKMLDYGDVVSHRHGPNTKDILKSLPEEERQELKYINRVIKDKTGFTYEELMARRKILEDAFLHKNEASFDVTLF